MKRYTDEEKLGRIKQLAIRVKDFARRNRSKILIAVSSILITAIVAYRKIRALNFKIDEVTAQKDRFRDDLYSAREVAKDLSDRLGVAEKLIERHKAKHAESSEQFKALSQKYGQLSQNYDRATQSVSDLQSKLKALRERINTLSDAAMVESYKLETMKSKADELLRQQMDIFARSRNIEGTTTTRNIRKQVNAVFEQIIGD